MSENKISRRGFIKSAAAISAAAATSGLISQTPAFAVGAPVKWDKETDFVVIGGGTGLAGALAAAVGGAKVVLLEKQAATGGTTSTSGGVIWVPNNSVMKAAGIKDSREDALKYMRAVSEGQIDGDVLAAWLDKGPEMVDFVAANSAIKWRLSTLMANQADYLPEWPGGIKGPGRSLERDSDAKGYLGRILTDGLLEACEAKKVEVLVKTPAKQLITRFLDSGLQEVLGVVADAAGKTVNIKANKGVLLAAGGYDWDADLKRHFLRGPMPINATPSGNVGDGLKMAMAAGADLRNMNEAIYYLFIKVKGERENAKGTAALASMIAMSEAHQAGAILVNRFGERFTNEATSYSKMWRSFLAFDDFGENRWHNLPAFAIFDNKVRENGTVASVKKGTALPDFVTPADSLVALAKAIGVDPAGLKKTVAEFNKYAQDGKDPQYHRGESYYDRNGADTPAAILGTVDQPPFFAYEVAPGTLGTGGGPRINANSQVLDPYGRVIPRLYAAGCNAGVGFPGAGYAGGGCAVGQGMIYSYLAGKHVVTLDAWKPAVL